MVKGDDNLMVCMCGNETRLTVKLVVVPLPQQASPVIVDSMLQKCPVMVVACKCKMRYSEVVNTPCSGGEKVWYNGVDKLKMTSSFTVRTVYMYEIDYHKLWLLSLSMFSTQKVVM